MRKLRCHYEQAKGWYSGPWDSDLAASVGYAHVGVDEPHLHTHIREIYLIARGSCTLRVEKETVELQAGDVLIIEPGEAHTFAEHSSDYFHFVLHLPGLAGEQARADKVPVERLRLGQEVSQ